MIQHIRILSIFPFVRISKIRTYAPSFEMNRPPKWCFITWRLASCTKPKLIFLFSDNGTKINSALRKMPLTDLRHTIWTGDAYHPQTIFCWEKGTQIILRNTSGSVKLHFIQCFNALNKKSACHSAKKRISCY